jgi:pSer/pThr/pTyr-binding forkhead associated (FHA) protein
MDRFEKLLGKKPERPAGDERLAPQTSAPSPMPVQPFEPVSPIPQPDPGATSPDGSFGLKFIFDNGETRMFTTLPITIGRAPDNLLVIQDDSVSAHHAVVLYDDRVREICLVDLESLNGVSVGDQPTIKNVLTDGARIGLGKARLVYRDTGYIHSA